MARESLVSVSLLILHLLHGKDLKESPASTYHQTSRRMLSPLSGMLDLEKEVQVLKEAKG